jgi:hypothetical protein
MEISTRPIVRVVETETGGTRDEGDAPHSVRWDERRSFLRSAIHIRRNELSMPMQLFWGIRVIVHLDRHRLAFFETH